MGKKKKKSSSGKRRKSKNTTKKAHKSDIETGVICGDGKRFATCQKCEILGNTKSEKAKQMDDDYSRMMKERGNDLSMKVN